MVEFFFLSLNFFFATEIKKKNLQRFNIYKSGKLVSKELSDKMIFWWI